MKHLRGLLLRWLIIRSSLLLELIKHWWDRLLLTSEGLNHLKCTKEKVSVMLVSM